MADNWEDNTELEHDLNSYVAQNLRRMATIHAYLMNKIGIMDDATDSIIYSPSTSNKIERWWRDLHERLERYFKAQLRELLESLEYDPNCNHDRQLIAHVYIPTVQRECNTFVD